MWLSGGGGYVRRCGVVLSASPSFALLLLLLHVGEGGVCAFI